MISFLIGVVIASALAACAPGVAEVALFDAAPWQGPAQFSWAAALVVVAQALASALVADVFHAMWPRRVLMRGRFNGPALSLGMISGSTGSVWVVVAAALAYPRLSEMQLLEPVLAAGCTALATLAVLACARGAKAGACAACGYDLGFMTPAAHGRCPECGRDQFVRGSVHVVQGGTVLRRVMRRHHRPTPWARR